VPQSGTRSGQKRDKAANIGRPGKQWRLRPGAGTVDSFGYWLRRRRKALDLTQEALAGRVSCSVFSIRKIEADERRRHGGSPSGSPYRSPYPRRSGARFSMQPGRCVPRAICAWTPCPSGVAAPAASTQFPPAAAAGAPGDATPFVGAASSTAPAHRAHRALGRRGTGYTVLIEGEPGIGKSRLMREVARYAGDQGLPTLATNCYEIERATPYQPVIDLVTRALDLAPAAALRNLAPVSLAELAPWFRR